MMVIDKINKAKKGLREMKKRDKKISKFKGHVGKRIK